MGKVSSYSSQVKAFFHRSHFPSNALNYHYYKIHKKLSASLLVHFAPPHIADTCNTGIWACLGAHKQVHVWTSVLLWSHWSNEAQPSSSNEKRSVFFDCWTQLSRTRQLKNESVTDEIFYTQNTSWTKNVLLVCVFLFHLCPLLLLGLHSVHYWGYATGH